MSTENGFTHRVRLWLDNVEPTYLAVHATARAVLESSGSVVEFADWLKAMVEDGVPELKASVYSDLLTVAIASVDWYELAKDYLEEEREEAALDA